MLKRNQRVWATLFAIVFLLACSPFTTPSAPPTFDLLSINTSIAQTAGAAATQTFVLLPTATITQTITPVPTEIPSSTPTFIFILSTSTVPTSTPTQGLSSLQYNCQVLSQGPLDDTTIVAGQPFQAHWLVRNLGTETWGTNSADIRYYGGAKLHRAPVLDMENAIPSGEKLDVYVNMWAPVDPGTYTTTWKIKVGKTEFCSMKVKIIVQ